MINANACCDNRVYLLLIPIVVVIILFIVMRFTRGAVRVGVLTKMPTDHTVNNKI